MIFLTGCLFCLPAHVRRHLVLSMDLSGRSECACATFIESRLWSVVRSASSLTARAACWPRSRSSCTSTLYPSWRTPSTTQPSRHYSRYSRLFLIKNRQSINKRHLKMSSAISSKGYRDYPLSGRLLLSTPYHAYLNLPSKYSSYKLLIQITLKVQMHFVHLIIHYKSYNKREPKIPKLTLLNSLSIIQPCSLIEATHSLNNCTNPFCIKSSFDLLNC